MKFYAILITEFDIELITLLNQGVAPKIEEEPTYFIFDASWNTKVPNEIVTEEEFLKKELEPHTTLLWNLS